MTAEERAALIKEKENLGKKVKSDPFIDPRDMRRIDDIMSLLLSDGETTELRLCPGKMKRPHRVTPFNRTRS